MNGSMNMTHSKFCSSKQNNKKYTHIQDISLVKIVLKKNVTIFTHNNFHIYNTLSHYSPQCIRSFHNYFAKKFNVKNFIILY